MGDGLLGSGGVLAGPVLATCMGALGPQSKSMTQLTLWAHGKSPGIPKFFLPLDNVVHIHSLLYLPLIKLLDLVLWKSKEGCL